MKVYLNEINGISDAISTMFISKRHMDREKEQHIINLCDKLTDRHGMYIPENKLSDEYNNSRNEFDDLLTKVCTWGKNHTTLLRFIDLSFSVYGLHRAGQDDWDAHASRYNNRIIRSSTRLATFQDEMSDYYQGKIMTTDQALSVVEMKTPESIVKDGITYVKTVNGYIREDMKDDKDVRRGLYMLSIPSNFLFKVNLTEFAHVYKERNENGGANPEVKQCCEACATLLEQAHSQFNRQLLLDIKN